MKGQQEVITPLLMTGILVAVVLSVYLWGVPLIEKNQDITKLQKAENFMRSLNEKIKTVARTEGREVLTSEIGKIRFDPSPSETGTGSVILEMNTKGTIYAVGYRIPFVRNHTCHWADPSLCIISEHEPELFYAESDEIDGAYFTTYTLTYRELFSTDFAKSYRINLMGTAKEAGSGHDIVIEHKGSSGTDNMVIDVEVRIL